MSREVYLETRDYSVSGEDFKLMYDKELDMLITYPVPDLSKLGSYYESADYISHTDSNNSFVDKVYQVVKNYAIGKKIELLSSYCSEESSEYSVLDIGCGTGDFLLGCNNSNFNVVGVEPNEKARNLAEAKLGVPVYSNLSDLIGKKYDFITMWHVLEHVPNLDEYLDTLKELLSDNGILIVAVPNYKSYDAKFYGKFWAAYDVPRHLSHFSKTSISKLFLTIGLNVHKHVPMKFDSFYVSLLSEKYRGSFLAPLRAMFVGFLSNLKAKVSGEYSSIIYVLKKQ